MSRFLRVVFLLTFCSVTTLTVNADTFTFTFEAPQFTVGEINPISNRAPNVGSAIFQASFVSAVPGTYEIVEFVPNAFTGQSLVSPETPNVLTISFNMPVNQIQFQWAVQLPGLIQFTSAAGNQSQNSANQGGPFEGGTFIFSSATPFTSFTLAAFNAAGAATNLGIDNLTLGTTPVPEPATLFLFGTGLAALAKFRKRKR
jgi:PEP-CTERM motif